MTTVQNQPKNQGFFGNLAFNIIIPVVLMSYASSEDYLGPAWSIVAALSFPIGYGLWDLKQSGKILTLFSSYSQLMFLER